MSNEFSVRCRNQFIVIIKYNCVNESKNIRKLITTQYFNYVFAFNIAHFVCI